MDIPNIVEQKKRRIYDLLNHFNFSEQSKLKIKELIEKVSTEELEYELKTNDFHNILAIELNRHFYTTFW